MPTGLQKMVVELPFDGKLEQKESQQIRPQSDFTKLTNVDLSEPGKIKRRVGFADMSISTFGGAGFGNIEKLAARGDELLSLQNTQITLGSGAGTGNAGDSILSYSPSADRWKNHAKIPRPTLRKILTNREGDSHTSSCAVTDDGKYMMVAWVATAFKYSGGVGQGVLAQIYDISISPPVLIEDTFVLDSTAATTAPLLVKCIALGNGDLVACWNYSGAASAFVFHVNGYSTVSRTWRTEATIAPHGGIGIDFDVVPYTTTSFVVAMRWDSAARLILRQVSLSGATYAQTATLVSTVTLGLIAFAVSFHSGVLTVLASTGSDVYYYRAANLTTFATDALSIATGGSSRWTRVGIVGVSSTDSWAFWWDRGVGGATPTATSLAWQKMVSGAGSGGQHTMGGVALTHNPFQISGRVYIPVAGADPEVTTGFYFTRYGYALFEIDTANPANIYATGMCAASWATDIGNHKIGFGSAGEYTYALRGCVVGSKYYQSDFVVGEFTRGHAYGNVGLTTAQDALDIIQFDFADPKRWDSRQHNGQTIFAGAMPWVYDGASGYECGWIWRARCVRAIATNGGSLVADTTYNVRVVYEYLDGDQRYWYSAPNYAVEPGEASASFTTTTLNKTAKITVKRPCFTAMDKAYTNQTIRPRILVFMTNPPVSGDEEYFLAVVVEYDPRAQAFQDVVVSSLPSDQEKADRPYNFGGELDNYGPPPCQLIENHRDRLFAYSTYDFRLWYTKPSTIGRGVEWVLEQSIMPPEEIVAIASNESALICFTSRSIYALEGYGPSPTGLPPDAFSRLVLVTAEVGCSETAACARTPVGIIFRAHQGWYLLTRTMELNYIGAPVESTFKNIASYTTRSIDVDLKKGCVRIMVSDTNEDFLFIYWYDTNRWSIDTLPTLRTWRDQIVIKDSLYMADTDAVCKRSDSCYEDTQHGSDKLYTMVVQTGWIRFDTLTQMKRVWRELLSCRKLAASDLRVIVSYDFDFAKNTVVSLIADTDLDSATSYTLRFHNSVQKVKSVLVYIADYQSFNPPGPFDGQTEGFELYGLGFELGLKRGAAKSSLTETR